MRGKCHAQSLYIHGVFSIECCSHAKRIEGYRYIRTITTDSERYRRDAGKKRCIASYLDPTLIEVETYGILPIDSVD